MTDPIELEGLDVPDARTLDRQIADALIDDIIAWRILPGAWIRERMIAEAFGVSHGPVREAFRHLSQAGFVEVVPWRGAHVIEMTPQTVQEIYALWGALFGTVCRLAAERYDDRDGAEFERLMIRYEDRMRHSTDTEEHFSLALELGGYIKRLAASPLASTMLEKVTRLSHWVHHLAHHESLVRLQPGLGMASAGLYRVVVEAVKARLPDEAERAARELIEFTLRHITRILPELMSQLESPPAPAPKGRRANKA